ncbi:MAG: RDD family protein [Halochromatium sp.]|uniref:RDD family protein n=1 Tax=Halochromatium sp. TaxID=2049430 RepID=UPI00397AB2AC
MTDLSPFRSPGLPRRLAAILYDLLLLAAVLIMAASVYTIAVVSLTGADLTQGSARLLFQLYLLLVILGYYLYFWTHGRQTLPMRVWRLLILRADGAPLGTLDALRRLGFALLTLAPAGLGLWWMLFDRDQQTWYDRLAGTRTLLLRKDADRHRSTAETD